MEEQATLAIDASTEYVGRWHRLVSTTNWEKGRIISEWRAALQEAGAPAASYGDELWSQQVGNVTPGHIGRLRRVYERFGEVFGQYPGLYWSHFQAALDWPDAEMWLEGAVQSDWTVSQMRAQRWEAIGAPAELKPRDADIVAAELDEDVSASGDEPLPAVISDSLGEVRGAGGPSEDESQPDWCDQSALLDVARSAIAAPSQRPLEALPPLPPDLSEAFDLLRLAILNHKTAGWQEISRSDVLTVLESIKHLILSPAE